MAITLNKSHSQTFGKLSSNTVSFKKMVSKMPLENKFETQICLQFFYRCFIDAPF
uniref:Uncharacterized protein n=1 Tax=Lepeophtheirus salmonis TaxID=72036 RepID=A0A0K2T7U9_LEPSM